MSDIPPADIIIEQTLPGQGIQTPHQVIGSESHIGSVEPSYQREPRNDQLKHQDPTLEMVGSPDHNTIAENMRNDPDRGVFQVAWEAVAEWLENARTGGSSTLHGQCKRN